MKKSFTLSLSLLPLVFQLAGCAQEADAPGEEEERLIEVTAIGQNEAGEQVVKITYITRDEQQRMAEDRRREIELAAEGLGEGKRGGTEEKLTAQQDPTCAGPSLWIYSQPNRTGNQLCVRNIGHEGGGSATFAMPSNWIKANGGNYPMSYWTGEDSGIFYPWSGSEAFNLYTMANTVSSTVQDALNIRMDRALPRPSADPSLDVPAGSTLIHRMHAIGHQIYVCKETSPGAFAWSFSAPSAVLTDPHIPGDALAHHYVGPTWRSIDDGSTVRATSIASVPSPFGSIPSLKLQAVENTGGGLFGAVKYIQRLNTSGGTAPSIACGAGNKNQVEFVVYYADYYFYASDTLPAGWTCNVGWYNANDGCDCNCGAVDPDCSKPGQGLFWCASGQSCNLSGHCE